VERKTLTQSVSQYNISTSFYYNTGTGIRRVNWSNTSSLRSPFWDKERMGYWFGSVPSILSVG